MLMGQFFTYLMVYFKVESRTARMEKDLPDALQLIASNLHAGMTPYRAIKLSSRKEFGPLSVEFNKAVSKGLGVNNFSKELLAIGERTQSVILSRTLKLITSSLSSGSHLAMLLEELSEDIADTQSLKNEMVTNTKTYSMFIMFTIIAGAPLLLAISVHFVGMVQNMQQSATLSTDEFGLGFLAGELTVTPEFLTTISFAILAVTSMLATMFTGVITKGNMTSGLKYSPVIMSASMVLFVLAKYIIGNFF
jgi:flagellar protein FlaJ